MGIRTASFLVAWLAAGGAAAAIDVPLHRVAAGTPVASFVAEGHLEPVRQATLAAQVAGNVLVLAVKAGEPVRAGQLVARIDERDALAGLHRGDATLAQAEAEARQARLDADRQRELHAQGFVSRAALDTAQTRLDAALSAAAAARAGRAQAALARGHATVSAPFDGIVLATHLDAGDLAAPGRPLATIAAPAPLRASVPVPLSRADAARRATRIEVELPDGTRVQPVRRAELASADAVSQTIEWRLELPAAATTAARPGQAVRVHFQAATAAAASPGPAEGALLLPKAAVLRRGELTAVYLAQGNRFVLRAVRLGADRGDAGVEVHAGLKAGDLVAADAVAAGLADARPLP